MIQTSEFYQKELEKVTGEFVREKKKSDNIALLRLISAISAIASFVLLLNYETDVFLWFLIFSLICFIVFISLSRRINRKKQFLQQLIKINKDEIDCLSGIINQFDSGERYIDSNHPFSYDLDVFGNGSFFQYINRTFTQHGSEKLASLFNHPVNNVNKIHNRQYAIKELGSLPEFRHHYLATGRMKENSLGVESDIHQWINLKPKAADNQFILYISYISPVALMASILISIAGINTDLFTGIFLVINWLVLGNNLKEINQYHMLLSKKQEFADTFQKLLSLIKNQKFNSQLLQQLKSGSAEGIIELNKIKSLLSYFDFRLNILFAIFVNSIFLYDIHLIRKIEKWKKRNKDKIFDWLDITYETEALNSLATYAFNNPAYIYPEIISTEQLIYEAENSGHPLIFNKQNVLNNFNVSDKMFIITGANMAGKSTFLRTLGLNLVIAYTGAPVNASIMRCGVMNIYSSMRISDVLQESKSYFYAELQRLQKIMTALKSGEKVVILVDEMLKGTNSNDKLSGSEGFIEQLLRYNCIGAVATHDLGLGEMENKFPGKIENYCFESLIENNELYFDYKLKRGVAQNKNATFLMKKMDIIK
ncbi:MAG: MutS-related protein [Cytophagaceae bacterium]